MISRVFFSVNDKLGSGSYGDVYKCTSENGTKYAIKVSKTEAKNKDIRDEDSALSYLWKDARAADSNIIQRYGIKEFSDNKIGLVLELLGRSLNEYANSKENGRSLREVRVITKQLVKACSFIHGLGVIHSDIKPENVLLSLDGTSVKLADFDAAFLIEKSARYKGAVIQTPIYRSPEVILGIEPTSAIDMWSLAVLIADVYINKNIFCPVEDDVNKIKAHELVAYHHFRLEKKYPDSLVEQGSVVGQKVFKDSLSKSVTMVNTLSQLIINASYLKNESREESKQLIDLLGKIFDYNPKSRAAAADVLKSSFASSQESVVSLQQEKKSFDFVVMIPLIVVAVVIGNLFFDHLSKEKV